MTSTCVDPWPAGIPETPTAESIAMAKAAAQRERDEANLAIRDRGWFIDDAGSLKRIQ